MKYVKPILNFKDSYNKMYFVNSYRFTQKESIVFTTNKNGTFSPSITTSDTSVAKWTVEGVGSQTTNTPSFSLDGASRSVTLEISDVGKITGINLSSQNVVGSIDLSLLISCTTFNLYSNAELTSITNPTSNVAVTIYHAYSCNLSSLNLSGLSGLGGSIQLQSNANLTSITNPTSSQTINLYNASNCNLSSLNLSGLSGLGGIFGVGNNINLTSIINPISSRVFSFYHAYNCNLSSLNLSGLTGFGGNFAVYTNANLTDITFPSTSTNFSLLNASSCALGVIDWSTLSGVITSIQLQNNAMTSAEVDENLVGIDTNLNLTTTLNIGGNNDVATDGTSTGFDGLTAISNLQGEGVTVTYN